MGNEWWFEARQAMECLWHKIKLTALRIVHFGTKIAVGGQNMFQNHIFTMRK